MHAAANIVEEHTSKKCSPYATAVDTVEQVVEHTTVETFEDYQVWRFGWVVYNALTHFLYIHLSARQMLGYFSASSLSHLCCFFAEDAERTRLLN